MVEESGADGRLVAEARQDVRGRTSTSAMGWELSRSNQGADGLRDNQNLAPLAPLRDAATFNFLAPLKLAPVKLAAPVCPSRSSRGPVQQVLVS